MDNLFDYDEVNEDLYRHDDDDEEDTSIEVEAEVQNEQPEECLIDDESKKDDPLIDIIPPKDAPVKNLTVKDKKLQYTGSYAFIATLKEHLDNLADTDELFAPFYSKKDKTIEECAAYIMGEAYKNKINGYTDDEVFGMAVHYYEEGQMEIHALPAGGRVVVNHTVELTAEELDIARRAAIAKVQADNEKRMQKPKSKPKQVDEMPSLF